MAASKKNNKIFLYLVLVFAALVLLLLFFGKKGKPASVSSTPVAQQKVTTAKTVSTTTPTEKAISSGPVGSNFLTAKAGPKSGQVTLSWIKAAVDTDKYSIVYRINPGKYVYGVVNAVTIVSGVSSYSYVVNVLTPGQRYYFAIVPQKSVKSVAISPEVSVVVW